MPFRSKKQRQFMHINHPEIAQRWEKEAKNSKQSAIQRRLKAKQDKKNG